MNVPPDRRGTPQPLPFYLSAAALAQMQGLAAALQPGTFDPQGLLDRADQATRELRAMIEGIDKWHSARAPAPPPDRPVIWQFGNARLLDTGGDGQITLIIPSLINRAYILDLDEAGSFLTALQKDGLRPVLLDWGSPTPQTNTMDLSDHVTRILIPAVYFLSGMAGGPVRVLGYCMGGTLALALAQAAPAAVARLAMIGAPWRFGNMTGTPAALRNHVIQTGTTALRTALRQTGATYGAIPSDLFQSLFALLCPLQASRKFSRFAGLPEASPENDAFVRIETWVNDPVAVPAAAAEELLVDWYCESATTQGRWLVNGAPITLDGLAQPALSVRGGTDHIVPPDMAVALRGHCAEGHDLDVSAGHVGMVAGRAHAQVAYRVCAFLTEKNIS